ncbi:MAG: FAD-binding oxidoreductase [Rubrivivax sp.]|nr:FAD-binding oxidoreductase [Rubrivivax sp.]
MPSAHTAAGTNAAAAPRGADVIIVGAGIHGCSTALFLALRGAKVLVLEKDHCARHASGVNAGGVRQLMRHVAEIPLSVLSMGLWERIAELVDDDCGFESHGQVLVAESEADLQAMRERVADLQRRGFTHEELIDRRELKALVPAVADHCPGGIVSRRDGAAIPFRSTQAIYRAAQRAGARFVEGVPVAGVKRHAGQWHVRTAAGEFSAPVVVNAAGAWADRLAAAVGEPVPLEPIAPMLMITSRVPHFIKPVVILRSRKLSFKQFENGTVMIGGGHLAALDRDRNHTQIDWRKLRESARTVWELFPAMRGATIVRAWAGIEGRMTDDLPVVGPSQAAPGFYHQFGFSAHGFQLGPGTGQAMAELIATSKSPVPIDGLGVGRFATGGGARMR